MRLPLTSLPTDSRRPVFPASPTVTERHRDISHTDDVWCQLADGYTETQQEAARAALFIFLASSTRHDQDRIDAFQVMKRLCGAAHKSRFAMRTFSYGPQVEFRIRLNTIQVLTANITLEDLDLSRCDLSGADLRGVSMVRVDLSGADLSGADLTDGILKGVKLTGTNFRGTNLTGTSIGCWHHGSTWHHPGEILADWSETTMKTELDHLTNENHYSLFTAIDSMGAPYDQLKLALTHQLIDSLKHINTSSVHDAMVVSWLNKPLYYTDPQIYSFVCDLFYPRIILSSTGELRRLRNADLRFMVSLYSILNPESKKSHLLNNDNLFVQFILQSIGSADQDIRSKAQSLYTYFLALPELVAARAFISTSGIELDTIVDDDPAFAFIRKKEDGTWCNLVLSTNSIHAMLGLDRAHDWKMVAYFENSEDLSNIASDRIYAQFELFDAAYSYRVHGCKINNLLKIIPLDQTKAPEELGLTKKDYWPIFEAALSSARSDAKLCNPADQNTLKIIFSPLLEQGIHHGSANRVEDISALEKIHYAALLRTFDIEHSTREVQAQHLLSLAVVFTTLSSMHIFGETSDSPVALRYYAAALLKNAYQLDPTVFGADNNYRDWINRLVLGKKKAFTCTAELAINIKEHIKGQPYRLRKIFHSIKPPAL